MHLILKWSKSVSGEIWTLVAYHLQEKQRRRTKPKSRTALHILVTDKRLGAEICNPLEMVKTPPASKMFFQPTVTLILIDTS